MNHQIFSGGGGTQEIFLIKIAFSDTPNPGFHPWVPEAPGLPSAQLSVYSEVSVGRQSSITDDNRSNLQILKTAIQCLQIA